MTQALFYSRHGRKWNRININKCWSYKRSVWICMLAFVLLMASFVLKSKYIYFIFYKLSNMKLFIWNEIQDIKVSEWLSQRIILHWIWARLLFVVFPPSFIPPSQHPMCQRCCRGNGVLSPLEYWCVYACGCYSRMIFSLSFSLWNTW